MQKPKTSIFTHLPKSLPMFQHLSPFAQAITLHFPSGPSCGQCRTVGDLQHDTGWSHLRDQLWCWIPRGEFQPGSNGAPGLWNRCDFVLMVQSFPAIYSNPSGMFLKTTVNNGIKYRSLNWWAGFLKHRQDGRLWRSVLGLICQDV